MTGFRKRVFEHCYTQNIKAPGLMVSEKFLYAFPIVSICELMSPGMGPI